MNPQRTTRRLRFVAPGLLLLSLIALAVLFGLTAFAGGVVGDGTPGSCTEAALDTALAGGGTVTFNCGGAKTITVTAEKTIAANTTIDGGGLITLSGNNSARVLNMNAGVTLNLQNLTIANGYAANAGGGVGCLLGGTLTATNSTFTGNSAASGGAIYGCALTITNSTFTGNSATGDYSSGTGLGGAIACVMLTVTNSTFSGNTAQRGGAIKCDGALTVTDSTFTNNSVNGTWYPRGGAMLIYGTTSISNSTFSGNSATGSSVKSGGAIDMPAAYGLTITNSTFFNNSVSGVGTNWGGAIYKSSSVPSTVTITNSTFDSNGASGGTSNLGGGIYNDGVTTVTLRNTIMSNSSCSGAMTDGGNNIDWGATCGASSSANPLLGALANNGGPTQTMALQAGSPAINAANPANCPATDQRGYSRSGTCDVGAYEYGGSPPSPTPTPTPTTTACSGRPAKPQLVSPTNLAKMDVRSVPLDWDPAACADDYKVIVRDGSKTGDTAFSPPKMTDTQVTTTALRRRHTYFWKVKACNASGCRASVWRSFKIKTSATFE